MKKELFIITGKTFSGKTTFANSLYKCQHILEHTTRPKRKEEINKKDYYFEKSFIPSNQVLGERQFKVINNKNKKDVWKYWFNINDFDPNQNSYIITDLLGAKALLKSNIDSLFNTTILYIYAPMDSIINRIRYSKRNNENLRETLRRLEDDINKYSIIDNEILAASKINGIVKPEGVYELNGNFAVIKKIK